ncbi:MAG: type II secretion system protein [Patescibacteria group bacterium]|nr:type II secretion system protein [Patescibacteria group bacterium]
MTIQIHKKIKKGGQAGFTLIEILLVMIIISVLVGLGLGSFRGSQIKSRDAKRVADLDQLARALEVYYSDKGHYPVSTADGLIRIFYDANEDGEIEDDEYMDFNWGNKLYDPEHSSTIYMGNLAQETAGDFRYYYQAYHRDFNTDLGDSGEYELSAHEETEEPDNVEAEGFAIYARLENEENSKYRGELEVSCDSNPVETTPCSYVISSSNIQLTPTPEP